jgi:hypothetical protein
MPGCGYVEQGGGSGMMPEVAEALAGPSSSRGMLRARGPACRRRGTARIERRPARRGFRAGSSSRTPAAHSSSRSWRRHARRLGAKRSTVSGDIRLAPYATTTPVDWRADSASRTTATHLTKAWAPPGEFEGGAGFAAPARAGSCPSLFHARHAALRGAGSGSTSVSGAARSSRRARRASGGSARRARASWIS